MIRGLGCAVSLFGPASPCGEAPLTLLARIARVNVPYWGVQNQVGFECYAQAVMLYNVLGKPYCDSLP